MGKVTIEGNNEMKFCDRLLDKTVNHRGSIKESLESGKCGQMCVWRGGGGVGEGVV